VEAPPGGISSICKWATSARFSLPATGPALTGKSSYTFRLRVHGTAGSRLRSSIRGFRQKGLIGRRETGGLERFCTTAQPRRTARLAASDSYAFRASWHSPPTGGFMGQGISFSSTPHRNAPSGACGVFACCISFSRAILLIPASS